MGKRNGEVILWLREAVASRDRSECWPFPFAISDRGYPMAHFEGRVRNAAGIALHLDGSERPSVRHEVCHSCSDDEGKSHRACVNPAHVRWGTRSDNVQDMLAAGTHVSGFTVHRDRSTT